MKISPSSKAVQQSNGQPNGNTSPSTNLSSQDAAYAKRHRKLLDQLVAIGIEKILEVPKIAVVGSQSAGKSSILEALSGITFPRDAGTCTRCPSEVRLYASDEDWTCKVSLRFDKDANGNRLSQSRNVPFGGTITDPSKVQQRLVQAQRAILNPNQSPQSFLQEKETAIKSEEDGETKVVNELQFSENVICIEVRGNNVRDLAVVDLPGLIANVGENEDERNIDLIKNLAKNEIAKEDCIILLCVTMSEDFQNQPSVTMAREADPTGARTLGVLTKPDRVEEGVFDNWKPVLEGKEQKLHHGYYVVKNPDKKQLEHMNHEQARKHEKDFFLKKPWSTLGATITSRLGSGNLAAKLSMLLEQIIKDRMPSIVKQVKEMNGQVKTDLSMLPVQVPEGQLVMHLNALIREFEKELQEALVDSQEEKSLAEDLYRISLDFWADMVNYRPRFLPLTMDEILMMTGNVYMLEGLKKIRELRDYLSEHDKGELIARGISKHGGPGNADDKSLAKVLMDVTQHTTKYGSSTTIDDLSDSILLLNLSEISSIKARATRDLLPNNTPWSVKKKLIEMCLQSWHDTAMQALKKIETRLMHECVGLIKQRFSRYQAGGLENNVNRIMEQLIAECVDKTGAFLSDLVKLESRHTTISTHKFVEQQLELKMILKEAREECRYRVNEGSECKTLTDNVDDELSLIAEILLYWQVAYKRYVDNVRSAFFTILLQSIADKCSSTLTMELGLFGEGGFQKVKNLLQEDQDTVQLRSELLAKQAMLTQSLDVINAFWSGSLKVEE